MFLFPRESLGVTASEAEADRFTRELRVRLGVRFPGHPAHVRCAGVDAATLRCPVEMAQALSDLIDEVVEEKAWAAN